MFWKNTYYYFTYEVEAVDKGKSIPPSIIKFVKRYLKLRFKKLIYFEPFSNSVNGKAAAVFGSKEVTKIANRNIVIWALELYASWKDPEIKVSDMFKQTTKKVKGKTITIYKVPKFIDKA